MRCGDKGSHTWCPSTISAPATKPATSTGEKYRLGDTDRYRCRTKGFSGLDGHMDVCRPTEIPRLKGCASQNWKMWP